MNYKVGCPEPAAKNKKGGENHRLFCNLPMYLVGCNSCCDQNQQEQRQHDAAGGASCFFDNNRRFHNRLRQVASKCGRCGAGQCGGENEFLHINLQIFARLKFQNRTPKTYLVFFTNQQ